MIPRKKSIDLSQIPKGEAPEIPYQLKKPISPKQGTAREILKHMVDMSSSEVDVLKTRIIFWQSDPVSFFEQVLGVGQCECKCQVSTQQRNIAKDVAKLIRVKEKLWQGLPLDISEEDFRDKIGISVKAGKGTGKTAILSMLYLWFLICFSTRQKHMVTAPRKESLKDNLFAEMSIWISHSKKVYGENSLVDRMIALDSTKLYLKYIYDEQGNLDRDAIGKQGVVLGRTCSRNADETTQKGTLQGYHEVYQMLASDEAFAVPNPVFEPLETTCTREVNFMFLIGNPSKNSGFMYETFNKNKQWWINHTMNAEESELVSKDHIKRLKIKYANYPAMYQMNVLGEFPLDATDTLIPFSKIMDAVERFKDLSEDDPRVKGKPTFLGFDIGAGVDPSVCYSRKGIKVERKGNRFMGSDTRIIARWALDQIDISNPERVGIDGITWGKGVFDMLRSSGVGNSITFVDARRKSSDKRRFKNLRAELHFRMADAFITGDIAIEDDDELIAELSILRVVEDQEVLQIVSKRKMRSEGIDSPNDTDAVTFTYYFNSDYFQETISSTKKDKYDFDAEEIGVLENGWMTL